MSTYRITLVQLKPDASAVGATNDKVEHGTHGVEEVVRLAGKLLQLDLSNTRAEPGIIVQRGDKGWRIGVHQGRLRMHKSMSLFDDFWTVDGAAALADLPPFQGGTTPTTRATHTASAPRRPGAARTVFEALGLFAAALVLVALGLRFGLPQRKLSDLPPGVSVVTSSNERAEIFKTVAGVYSTGKTAGNSLVIISEDGQVSLGTIGKDGKPTKPRIQEQAKAGRQGNIACVITSFGIIAGIEPPEAVKVVNFQWRKAPESVTAVN
ncbi:MAG TPA: hypothetical protein VF388_08145 [Lacunisphaera sp.]